jgi:tight adherence protein B
MVLAFLMFLIGAGVVIGAYAAVTTVPGLLERRRLERRLQDLSAPAASGVEGEPSSLLMKAAEGPLPIVDRLVSRTSAGSWLSTLIAQSGVRTTPSSVMVMSVGFALASALATMLFFPQLFLVAVVAMAAGCSPFLFLMQRRGARLRTFEEQFPEALDLLSRALRAGHAFQTAMGMVGDELKQPVGPEFKRTFDQQNFGLPLRDALNQLAERVPILDVRFFVTAVLIQRDTGGNLSEILDNLAHVVRERFKIRRQVRVHTAHGRFTAFVLLSLPAGLAILLSMLNPDHMALLFRERMGQLMLILAMVMQAVGFVWIRKIIKIEV